MAYFNALRALRVEALADLSDLCGYRLDQGKPMSICETLAIRLDLDRHIAMLFFRRISQAWS